MTTIAPPLNATERFILEAIGTGRDDSEGRLAGRLADHCGYSVTVISEVLRTLARRNLILMRQEAGRIYSVRPIGNRPETPAIDVIPAPSTNGKSVTSTVRNPAASQIKHSHPVLQALAREGGCIVDPKGYLVSRIARMIDEEPVRVKHALDRFVQAGLIERDTRGTKNRTYSATLKDGIHVEMQDVSPAVAVGKNSDPADTNTVGSGAVRARQYSVRPGDGDRNDTVERSDSRSVGGRRELPPASVALRNMLEPGDPSEEADGEEGDEQAADGELVVLAGLIDAFDQLAVLDTGARARCVRYIVDRYGELA